MYKIYLVILCIEKKINVNFYVYFIQLRIIIHLLILLKKEL